MRAVLVLLILVGGAAFFLTSREERTYPDDPVVAAWDGGRGPRDEEPIENPQLATEVEADGEGHVTIFLGDTPSDAAGHSTPRVTGRVIDPRGDAVQGLALAYRSNAEIGAEPDTEQVRCDSRGDFVLHARSTYAEFACEDSRWTLIFAGVQDEGSSGFHITFVAAPTTPCAGVVTDRAGRRVEGVRVQIGGQVSVPRERILTPHEFTRRADTDQRGQFDFGRVPLLGPTSLLAQSPELGSAQLELVSADDRPLTLVLPGGQ